MLSTRDVPLAPADYGAALGRAFDRWYLTAHHGGEHPHAHAVAFAARPLCAAELNAVRAVLGDRERARELARIPQPEPQPFQVAEHAARDHAREVSWW